MSSKERAHSNDKASLKQRSSKPTTKNLGILAQQQTHPATLIQRAELDPSLLTPRDVLQLQRTFGNRAVGKLLSETGQRQLVQPKLRVNSIGDRYEQEADRVAAQVVEQINTPVSAQSMQGQSIQRQAEPEADLQVKQSISDRQQSSLSPAVGLETMAEVADLQTKSMLQRQETIEGGEAPTDLESAINGVKGRGQPLDTRLQQSMGQAMEADFSRVRVHTDEQAHQLNQSIQAKAFTTGQDVFFRQRTYEPGRREGQEFITHELTHVVQQGIGEARVQRADIKLIGPGSQETITEIWNAYQAASEQLENWYRAGGMQSGQRRPAEPQIPWMEINDLYAAVTITGEESWSPVVKKRFKSDDPTKRAKKFTIYTGMHGNIGGQFINQDGDIKEDYRDRNHTEQDRQMAQALTRGNPGLEIEVIDVFEAGLRNPLRLRDAAKGKIAEGKVVILAWCFSIEGFTPRVGEELPRSEEEAFIRARNNEEIRAIIEQQFGELRDYMRPPEVQDMVARRLEEDLGENIGRDEVRRIVEQQPAEESSEEVGSQQGGLLQSIAQKCYITTACVRARGLADDCEELQTLRYFRDEYILNLPSGQELVQFYYDQSPKIVEAIAQNPGSAAIYEDLYLVIRNCVKAVHEERNQEAFATYVNMVLKLRDQYTPDINVPESLLEASRTLNQVSAPEM